MAVRQGLIVHSMTVGVRCIVGVRGVRCVMGVRRVMGVWGVRGVMGV